MGDISERFFTAGAATEYFELRARPNTGWYYAVRDRSYVLEEDNWDGDNDSPLCSLVMGLLAAERFFVDDVRPHSVEPMSMMGGPTGDSVRVLIIPSTLAREEDAQILRDLLQGLVRQFLSGSQKDEGAELGGYSAFLRGSRELRRAWRGRRLPSVAEQIDPLDQIQGDIEAALEPLRKKFQEHVSTLEGKNLGTLEENQRIARMIQETADKLGVLFLCTKCNAASRFRCSENPTAKTGVFVFAHGKNTHGGTTTIPPLKVY